MAPKKRSCYEYDPIILISVLLLLGIGLLAVYSASSILAEARFGDQYFYLKRQAVFCLFGLLIMIAAKNVNYLVYRKLVYVFLGLSVFLLVLLLIPGLGSYFYFRLQ